MSAPAVGGTATTAVTVKLLALLPDWVVTTMLPTPAGALAGTAVVIVVAEIALMVAATPLIVTPAPVKPDPEIVTTVPMGPARGETVVIPGAATVGAVMVKTNVATGETPVVTVMPTGPGVAVGTSTTICVLLLVKILALEAPKLTRAPLKLVPLIVICAFGTPLAGDTLAIIGGDVDGGVVVMPHPPVLMLSALLLYVMVTALAAVQVTPFTMTVCALDRVATPNSAMDVAASICFNE